MQFENRFIEAHEKQPICMENHNTNAGTVFIINTPNELGIKQKKIITEEEQQVE